MNQNNPLKPEPSPSNRLPKVADRMREMIPKLDQPFGRRTLFDLLCQEWPDMKAKATLVFTSLIDMTAGGELVRTGVGEAALYRIRKLRPVGSRRIGRFRRPRSWTFGFFDTKRPENFEDN